MERFFRLALVLVIQFALPASAHAQQATTKGPAQSPFHQIQTRLIIEQPVNLHEPGQPSTIDANPGDLVQLQIRYPVSPPMPVAATISVGQDAAHLVATCTTNSPVAILKADPQSDGKIGVGYVQLWVRAMKPGRHRVTARIKLHGDEVKDVPFELIVKAGQ